MTRVSSKITNNRQDIINLNNSKKDFIIFLKDILNISLKEINFIKILKFDFVSEYGFLLYKYKGKTVNNNEMEIYLKLIKNNRIKQSIFCYWSQVYEEELIEKECEMSIHRISIKENQINNLKKSIFLEIENNNTEILKNGTMIYLIDLIQYYAERKNNKLPFNIESDDVLLIGIKSNICNCIDSSN